MEDVLNGVRLAVSVAWEILGELTNQNQGLAIVAVGSAIAFWMAMINLVEMVK